MKKVMPILLIGFILLANPLMVSGKLTSDDFIDIKGHWAQNSIQAVCDLKLMTGMGSNQSGWRVFSPDYEVNRAQLAIVLVRTFQLDLGQLRFIKQPLASDRYRDVDNQSWYAEAALLCALNNVFNSTDHFYPDKPVSRIEIAHAIYRCFNAKGIHIPMIMSMPIYNDTIALSQEEMNAMVFVSNTGIMKGNNGYFRPEDAVLRGELAQIINRCMNLMSVNENDNNKEYLVNVGQSFMISLAGNPTTGYQWNIDNSFENKVLTLLDQGYQGAEGNDARRIGQGGHYYYRFKALQPGTTELHLNYSRPWESKQPLQTFTLKVIIKPTDGSSTNSSIK